MTKNPVVATNFLPGKAYPEQYSQLLAIKSAALAEKFSHFAIPEIRIVPSPSHSYRMRAEFRIWHNNNQVHYAMMSSGKEKTPYQVDEFTLGSALIQKLMPALLEQLNSEILLRQQLFQVNFLTSAKGEALITLIYHRQLDDQWKDCAQLLKQYLSKYMTHIHIVGRSRGQQLCVDQGFIYEQLSVRNTIYSYQQIEGGFTQPNSFINEEMLNWADNVTSQVGGDLLELYCGNGNFTLPLSKNFTRVLATEVSKTSINAALHNISNNQITNIEIARLSSEEASQAINRVRPFRRLAHINLDNYKFSTIMVDPPRAGLDNMTLEFVNQFDNICYISCNPDTLIENLQILTKNHCIMSMALFDQFPYTHHVECGVFLTKNSG